ITTQYGFRTPSDIDSYDYFLFKCLYNSASYEIGLYESIYNFLSIPDGIDLHKDFSFTEVKAYLSTKGYENNNLNEFIIGYSFEYIYPIEYCLKSRVLIAN